ncbi:MAG TPA: VWA domain-containing protein [Candidatus Aquilonibacter sp.]|nr:VWA domain-containing protein [Candidatus Aquilonibacter sp.]
MSEAKGLRMLGLVREGARSGLVWAMITGLCAAPALVAQTSVSAQSSAAAAAQTTEPNGNNQGETQVQIPPPPPQATSGTVLQSTSEVVRIDIQVADKSGKTIKGLKADQFTITDDGKPQKISNFSFEDIEAIQTAANSEDSQPVVVAVDTPRGTNPDTVATETRDRRLLVLYFDLSSMEPDDILRARDAATKFINTQMQKADLVSVVAYGTELSIWSDFTNNHQTLLKAIDRLNPNVNSELAANDTDSVATDTQAAFTADDTEFNTFNTDAKLEAIEGLANVLSGIPGRKSVIHFTGGITQTGEENRTELRAATDAANRADTSIYEIDARGLFATPPGGDVTSSAATGSSLFSGAAVYAQTDARNDSRDTLSTLATDTGGKAFYDLGDLAAALPEIQADNMGYYLASYVLPPNTKHDGSWHQIRVKVSGVPGAHVKSRDGYYAPRDFQHLMKQDKEDQLEEALESDDPIVELPIAVETAAFRVSPEEVYVPISAKISSSALEFAEKHDEHQVGFDFAYEVRVLFQGNPTGIPVVDRRDTINVKLDASNFEQVKSSNIEYQGGVLLSPGRTYRLKFIARENETGKLGTFEQNISIPAEPPDRMTLSSVLLSSQIVPVQKQASVTTKSIGDKAKKDAVSPLETNGEEIVPSVTRFFNTQQTLYVFFQAYYPDKGQDVSSLSADSIRGALIFFHNGIQVNQTPLVEPTAFDKATRTATFRISLPLAKLATGTYTVQAVAIAPGTQQSAFGRAYLALEQPLAPPSTPPAGAVAPADDAPATQSATP